MYSLKVIGLVLGLQSFFCNCAWENKDFERKRHKVRIEKIARLPEIALESSGLAMASEGQFWTHQDSGGTPTLMLFDKQGELIDTHDFSGKLKNIDWEDLAQDTLGNIYIGDVGNNRNQRKNLQIHKISPAGEFLGTIQVSYTDQEDFPPTKKDMNFDVEAIFWKAGKIHLFSKNRGEKCVKRYEVSDEPGQYDLSPQEAFYLNAMVTGADISPSGNEMALLAYGRIYFFELRAGSGFFDHPKRCVRFVKGGQSEAIAYMDESRILLTNEKGKVFTYSPKKNLD